MASPFPGMDPYLEDRALWNDVHHSMITYIRNALQAQVRPRYVVRIEERMYIEEVQREIVPDVSVLRGRTVHPATTSLMEPECDTPVALHLEEHLHTEGVIHILDRTHEMRVVTVIELLSPTNKEPRSRGWRLYRQKQEEILNSEVHLVEIDLLRGGDCVLAPPYQALVEAVGDKWHYMISVRRGDTPATFLLYPRTVRERLPRIGVPLATGDRDAVLDLGAVLTQCYEDGAYGDIIDYHQEPPPPPFSAEDTAWIDQLLREKGLR